MERYAKIAASALNTVLEKPISATDLEIPPDGSLGDFALPCFKLAKELRKPPQQVAQNIADLLTQKKLLPLYMKAVATGPYLNFRIETQEIAGTLLHDILSGDGLGSYGKCPEQSRGTWVLEYSSPNIAKLFNIYHLRPTALGAALDRIGRFRGFKVISINHLGDWGTQYGKLVVAYKLYQNEIPPKENLTVKDLVEIYVKFHQAVEKDPTLENQARESFRKLEAGDSEVTALWRQCLEIALKDFNRIYQRLGVSFDHIWGESHYKNLLTPLLDSLRKSGLLIQSEGAWVVTVTDEAGKELVPCIMQKSDGATIYATRDVAAAIYRYENFHFDRMTYIVGGEQKLHFQQIFSVLKKMGHAWSEHCEHVPTGLYRFKDQKMSTRKGVFITLEEVLDLAKERVQTLMKDRAKGAVVPDLDTISESVAVGAVVFHDLHTDPARDVEFEIERVVDFEGETGPYLQYAHTRCLSILRKARETKELPPEKLFFNRDLISKLQAPEEIALIKTLGQFTLHLERSLRFAKASQLAHYLIDVTRAFGAFYRECHVLGEAPEITSARLMLVEATRRLLARGLGLLGIPLPERM